MKTIREWQGKIKAKWKIITQKIKLPGKYKHLFNYRIILLLLFIISIALGVVFSQYPQVLTSFAKKPPRDQCGVSGNHCCPISEDRPKPCNPGLECYAPNSDTVPVCKSNASVCGNSVDRPCCLPDGGNERTQEFCNGGLACDTSIQPQYPYQNPWNSGMCVLSYDTCGGVDDSGKAEACCPDYYCDQPWKCVVNTKQEEICGNASLTIFAYHSILKVGYSIDMMLNNNILGKSHEIKVTCGNGQVTNQLIAGNYESFLVKEACTYSYPDTYNISVEDTVTIDAAGTKYTYWGNNQIVISSILTPTPTRTPTPKPTRTPTPRPSRTPTPVPTSAGYTCKGSVGSCYLNGNDCYERGNGTCESGYFCCKTENGPTATPTRIPPTNTPAPTKVPFGGSCSYNSQCASGNCCNNQCNTSGYQCPN